MAKLRQPKVQVDFHAKLVREALEEALVLKRSSSPLGKAAAAIMSVAIKSMRKGGGRIGPKGGKVQIPSTPPNPPHAQTGNLRGSISWGFSADRKRVIVGPTKSAAYGRIHEFGGAKHPPRPFMRPALIRARERYVRFFKNVGMARTRAGVKLNNKGRRR